MKASGFSVSAKIPAGPPIPNRVYRESGSSVKTVKLGIPARRACASSAVGITLIIEGGVHGIEFSRLFGGGLQILSGVGAKQPARVVSSPQTGLRRACESAHGGAGGGAQRVDA